MVRCPACHRRLRPGACCPRDGASGAVPAPEAPPAPPILPGFQVHRLLGAGGFASVWEATASGEGPPLAVKLSHVATPESSRRFAQEAEVLARVGRPHAPALMGSGALPDGRSFLAMERLPGPSLAAELAGWPEHPPPAAANQLAEALLAAVAAVHRCGVVHRDLKPENVFLSPASAGGAFVATLIDFGLTDDDRAAGTPEYMAPEQIAGGPADQRADVYAVGVMLYELLTLRLPFSGDRRALEYAHLSFRPPPPSRLGGVSSSLDEVVLRCLAKDPAARFPDAGAVLLAFAAATAAPAAAAGAPVAAPRPASPATIGRQRVALLFIYQPGLAAAELQAAVRSFGGQLAHVEKDRGGLRLHPPGRRAPGPARPGSGSRPAGVGPGPAAGGGFGAGQDPLPPRRIRPHPEPGVRRPGPLPGGRRSRGNHHRPRWPGDAGSPGPHAHR